MNRARARSPIVGGLVVVVAAATLFAWKMATRQAPGPVFRGEPAPITIDYPAEGSVFPPEFPAPTWLWRDADGQVTSWDITVAFSDGAPALHVQSAGEGMRLGESDPRCISATNKPPELTPQQAAAHTWVPDGTTWAAIKAHSVEGPAKIVLTAPIARAGFDSDVTRSRGRAHLLPGCSAHAVGE